jgi:hypothetical protein
MSAPVTAATRWQTWAIFGPSGVGKTTLAATAPKPIFLDSNQGLISVADRPGFEHLRSEDVFGIDNLNDAYSKCTETSKKAWPARFNTIVFDHFDDIQALVLDELGARAAERDSRRDQDEFDQRMYGIMGNKLRRLLRLFKKVPMHKVLILGEKPNGETGKLVPNLIGQLQGQLPYYCDHVLYLKPGKNDSRWLYLRETDEFFAKTRAWWLTKEQRRYSVAFDDTKFLTNLFATIAKGPTRAHERARKTTTKES